MARTKRVKPEWESNRLSNSTTVNCCICGITLEPGKGSTYVYRRTSWIYGPLGTFQFPEWNCGSAHCAELHFSIWMKTIRESKHG